MTIKQAQNKPQKPAESDWDVCGYLPSAHIENGALWVYNRETGKREKKSV